VVLDAVSLEEIKEAARGNGPGDYVFTWTTGNKKGKRIRDFRTSWNTACEAAKLPHRLFHNLRRSAVRRMIRRGVPPLVARRISGHLTTFDGRDLSTLRYLQIRISRMLRKKLGNNWAR
jgi:integrase